MKLILAQKKLFIYAIIASLLLTVFGIISSLFNKFFMDEILPYHLEKELLIYVIAFGLLGLTQAAVGFRLFQSYFQLTGQVLCDKKGWRYFNPVFR